MSGPRVALGSLEIPAEKRQAYLDNVIAKLPEADEPPPQPLGYDPNDPRGKAKDAALRLTTFLKNGLHDLFKLHPAETVFALELFATNLYNIADYPLSATEFETEIREAHRYWDGVRGEPGPQRSPAAPPPFPNRPNGKWSEAQMAAKRLLDFTLLMGLEIGLTPAEIIYAVELCACNFFNLRDFPLTPNAVDRVRNEASAFYMANR